MEAGNRCFDLRVPEEINRRIVVTRQISTLHIVKSRAIICCVKACQPIKLFIRAVQCAKSLIIMHATYFKINYLAKAKLRKWKLLFGERSQRRNVDDPVQLKRLFNVLEGLGDTYDTHNRFHASTHEKRIEALKVAVHPLVRFLKPFAFLTIFNFRKMRVVCCPIAERSQRSLPS